jgi:hypothetical protein
MPKGCATSPTQGVTLSDAAIANLLAVDTGLDAQDLEVWLKRRERRAATKG